MIIAIHNHIICRILIILTLVNFINLSADFYTPYSSKSQHTVHDPIDTVAELLLEYLLDMDQETIPDAEVPQEQRKFKDLKLFNHFMRFVLAANQTFVPKNLITCYINLFESIKIDSQSPPPKV
jgi:hypothetical protein